MLVILCIYLRLNLMFLDAKPCSYLTISFCIPSVEVFQSRSFEVLFANFEIRSQIFVITNFIRIFRSHSKFGKNSCKLCNKPMYKLYIKRVLALFEQVYLFQNFLNIKLYSKHFTSFEILQKTSK